MFRSRTYKIIQAALADETNTNNSYADSSSSDTRETNTHSSTQVETTLGGTSGELTHNDETIIASKNPVGKYDSVIDSDNPCRNSTYDICTTSDQSALISVSPNESNHRYQNLPEYNVTSFGDYTIITLNCTSSNTDLHLLPDNENIEWNPENQSTNSSLTNQKDESICETISISEANKIRSCSNQMEQTTGAIGNSLEELTHMQTYSLSTGQENEGSVCPSLISGTKVMEIGSHHSAEMKDRGYSNLEQENYTLMDPPNLGQENGTLVHKNVQISERSVINNNDHTYYNEETELSEIESTENSDSDYVPDEVDSEVEEGYITENERNIPSKNDIVLSSMMPDSTSGNNEQSENESQIYIQSSKEGTRRIKKHNCLFCNKLFKELSKHLEKRHSNEVEVSRILCLPKNCERRRKAFINLARLGDYYHNCEVLKIKKGELILARLPTPKEKMLYTYSDYGPCPDCLGFMLKRHLWHHLKISCSEKKEHSNGAVLRRKPISESTALIAHTFLDEIYSEEFTEGIVSALKNDKISLVCKQDRLIMTFAKLQFEKYHNTQNELIRQTIRQLGRLLLQLRLLNPNIIRLSDWLKPNHFDDIIKAVKFVCNVKYQSKKRPQYSIPSLALKLGYSLKKCIGIEKGISLRQGNIARKNDLDSLLSLMELEWASKISSNALATLSDRKLNATELLPLTDDLVKLNTFLDKKISEYKELLKSASSVHTWSDLASVVLCKIVLFNKRRSGEASRMTVYQYLSRPNWSQQTTEEFKNTFSELEFRLAARLAVVQIKGKRGNKVNLLLTDDVRSAIDLLIIHRTKYVSPENLYLFARGTPSTEHIRGHDCLRRFCSQAGLEQPELVNGTKLRKYIATVCQIFNLTETETDWLARHLGHDIRVHREFYRLHESAVELTKVSRILLAVEKGQANKFKGKKLDDIDISELPDMEYDENREEQEVYNLEAENEDHSSDEMNETSNLTAEMNQETMSKRGHKRPHEMGISDEVCHSTTEVKQKKRVRKWTNDESEAVLKYFRVLIKNKVTPGKTDCEKCIKDNQVLSSRSWKDLKYYVYNHIKKISKI